MDSWDDMKGNLSGWFDTAAHRTDRLARLGVRAYDRYGINRDLDRHFAQLGALVHRLLVEDPDAVPGHDAAVRAEMGRIARLQDELSNTETEMDDLRHKMETDPTAPSEASAAAAGSQAAPATESDESPVEPPQNAQNADPQDSPIEDEEGQSEEDTPRSPD